MAGSEADLIPGFAGEDVVAALADPLYAGLLSGTLNGGETVEMASIGSWLEDWMTRAYSQGPRGLMVLTKRRVVFIRPRRRTLGGKLKDRPIESIDLGTVFTSGKHKVESSWVSFSHNRHGSFESYLLKIDGANAELHASMWTNELWEYAIAAGGHENRPIGI